MKMSIEDMNDFARKYRLSKKSIVESIVASVIVMVASEIILEYYDQQDHNATWQVVLYRKLADDVTILVKQHDCVT